MNKKYIVHFILLSFMVSVAVAFDTAENIRVLSSVPRFTYTSFQEGIICNAAQPPRHPVSLQELQEIVNFAGKNNYTIKALGSRHSSTDIICTDGIPVYMQEISHFQYDPIKQEATVGAGTTMESFLERLHKVGRTIHGPPSFAGVTVGGATGTCAHGTGLQTPGTFSDQIVGVVVVDGLGNVRNITDPETLRAFRAHLGLLGIIYEVTVSTSAQYKLHISNYPESDSILWKPGEIMRLAKTSQHFQFFWFPTAKSVVMSVGNSVPISTPGNCKTYFISEGPLEITAPLSEALEKMQEGKDHLGLFTLQSLSKLSLYQNVPGRSPIFSGDQGKTLCSPAIGFSHRMTNNKCTDCSWSHGNASLFEMIYAAYLPIEELEGAINTINGILKEHPMEFPFTGIFVRFIPPSNGLIAMNSGRATVALEWVLVTRKDRFNKPMLGHPSSQAVMQALVVKHGARGHWGLSGPVYSERSLLMENFAELPTFIACMKEFDPMGVFLNDFGRRLRFNERKFSLDRYASHCALVDNCICQSDDDCSDGSPGSFTCGTIESYRVCKESTEGYQALRGKLVREFVGKLKQR